MGIEPRHSDDVAVPALVAEHTVRLETGAFLAPAVGLYTSSGYPTIPPFGPYLGHPASVCYEKALS